MENYKSFSELGIESNNQLTGKKIGINHVLNREILITRFRIDPSKFPAEGNGMRLSIEVKVDNEDHVIFTSSVILQDQLSKVPESAFPFRATIISLVPRGFKLV